MSDKAITVTLQRNRVRMVCDMLKDVVSELNDLPMRDRGQVRAQVVADHARYSCNLLLVALEQLENSSLNESVGQ